MADHRKIYQRFLHHLQGRQRVASADFDPRRYIEELGQHDCSVGYVDRTLTRAYGANLPRLLPHSVGIDNKMFGRSDTYVGCGAIFETPESSHPGLTKIFDTAEETASITFFELGFLASTASWSHSFKTQDPRYACLSFVFDDISHYYMSEYPNRLIHKLNATETLDEAQLERARRNIKEIVEHKISKYNAQPFVELGKGPKRVLVCDQTYADGSTVYGMAPDRVFQDMLLAAIRENPDAEVLVKTHPDTLYERSRKKSRPGFFSGLSDYGNVRFVREPMNPLVLMDDVDKVYVATSGMGFEALLCGKEVVCFGAPFYAGWGLTDDRRLIPHRHRQRSLEELFYYFYIWYTHYVMPGRAGHAEIEDVVDYIMENRPVRPVASRKPTAPPKVSVIIPVYNVEQYIGECLDSIVGQTLKDLEILVVNDRSPDNSQAIVDEYAARDPRVKPIVLENNIGQGFARNVAMDQASGKYVWFVDSDDYLASETFLANAVDAAERVGADMVRGRKRIQNEEGEEVRFFADGVERYFPEEIEATTLQESPVLMQNNHFWNFLYRREFLDHYKIRFELTQWEERPFLLKAMLNAEKISCLDEDAIMYRIRAGSTARRDKTRADIEKRHRNFELCCEHLKEKGADKADSPLHPHYLFCVSRWVPFFFGGFQADYLLSQDAEGRDELLRWVAKMLRDTGVSASSLTSEPHSVPAKRFESGELSLLYAACCQERFDIVDLVLRGEQMTQRFAYSTLLEESEGELGETLNDYLRHHVPAGETVEPSGPRRGIRLVLHIGSTKTGSTYLQHFCHLNRAALLRQGIWYPEFGLFWQPGRQHKTAGHANFLSKARSDNPELVDLLLSGLDVLGGRVKTIVLSSEAFFLADSPQPLLDQLSPFDLEVLVYLRRQDDWANSQYAEYVAGGAVSRTSLSPAQWIVSDKPQDLMAYDELLKPWSQGVAKGKLTVRPYERVQLHESDLLADFSLQVGIRDLDTLRRPDDKQANHFPFEGRHVMALRHFNRLPFPNRKVYFDFIEAVTQAMGRQREPGRKPEKVELLGPELRALILDTYASSNSQVAREYLGRQDGVLFFDSEISPRPAVSSESTVSLEELDTIFGLYRARVLKTKSSGSRNGRSRESNKLEQMWKRFKVGRKLAKLTRDPKRFFMDSGLPGFKTIGERLPSK